MSPSLLAKEAADRGIQILALTDHNCSKNCPAFAEACKRHDVTALFGMEVTTMEECHVLCIFDTLTKVQSMEAWIAARQDKIPLNLDFFTDQPVVDIDDHILELVTDFLGVAAQASIAEVRQEALSLGGLFIPSHINRPAFSVETQLGFLPLEYYDAVEVRPGSVATYRERYPSYGIITGSDAHVPEQIGTHPIYLEIKAKDLESIRTALHKLAINQC